MRPTPRSPPGRRRLRCISRPPKAPRHLGTVAVGDSRLDKAYPSRKPRAGTGAIQTTVRRSGSIYEASGEIQDGSFQGRWHFSFDMYRDPRHTNFGNLRVLNDDTLSPGATWPLHPHTQNEVVTYVAEGEFRHEDERGKAGVLHAGGVQHTTVGRGMYHAEINNRKDVPMRFIQIWYMPERLNMTPSVSNGRSTARAERTNGFLSSPLGTREPCPSVRTVPSSLRSSKVDETSRTR